MSLEIVKEYKKHDSWIKLITQENHYAGVAGNNGFDLSKGKYVMFLDAADVFDPHLIQKMTERMENYDADIVICNNESQDDKSGFRYPVYDIAMDDGLNTTNNRRNHNDFIL